MRTLDQIVLFLSTAVSRSQVHMGSTDSRQSRYSKFCDATLVTTPIVFSEVILVKVLRLFNGHIYAFVFFTEREHTLGCNVRGIRCSAGMCVGPFLCALLLATSARCYLSGHYLLDFLQMQRTDGHFPCERLKKVVLKS